MCMYDRRLQILLDERRYRRVAAAAQKRHASVASVIRDAIDLALPADLDRKREAAIALLAAEPVPAPEFSGLKAELDELRAGGR